VPLPGLTPLLFLKTRSRSKDPSSGADDTISGTYRLNAGVPATEVARRAGHSVAVLLKVYAHCIDGQTDTVNKRIGDALGDSDNRADYSGQHTQGC
jgi:hypothetical protein